MATGFLDLKRGLEQAPGLVVPSVTRAMAAVCEARINQSGIATRSAHHTAESNDAEPHAPGSPASKHHTAFQSLRDRPGTVLAVVIGTVLIVAVVAGVVGDRWEDVAGSSNTIDTQRVADLAEAATVHLSCGQQLGAGFFVTPELVVTNAHVLCPGNSRVSVTLSDGQTAEGRVLRAERWLDIGLVSVTGVAATPLSLGDATSLERGEAVVMMGSPRGMDFTLSQGIVSHPNRVLMGVSYVQIDAAVNPGNSGGPLLDHAGRAIGIVSMMVNSANNLGLALPINYLVDGLDPIIAGHDLTYDRQRWAERIEEAEEANRREVAEFRADTNRSGVVAAQLVEQGALVAFVIRMSDTRPNDSHLAFSLTRSGTELCSPSGIASQWRQVTPDLGGQDSRYLMWLERNGLAHETYASAVHLGMTGCPDPASIVGATLKLRNGAANIDQVIIEPGSMWSR
jgi:serine protease Do